MDITTEALATRIGIKAASIRHRVCTTGSYFGLTPVKLPNGRLLWPGDSKERLATAKPTPDSAGEAA